MCIIRMSVTCEEKTVAVDWTCVMDGEREEPAGAERQRNMEATLAGGGAARDGFKVAH